VSSSRVPSGTEDRRRPLGCICVAINRTTDSWSVRVDSSWSAEVPAYARNCIPTGCCCRLEVWRRDEQIGTLHVDIPPDSGLYALELLSLGPDAGFGFALHDRAWLLALGIEEMNLRPRIENALRRQQIATLGVCFSRSRVPTFEAPNIRPEEMNTVRATLATFGLEPRADS
jgi:hypothetical protein